METQANPSTSSDPMSRAVSSVFSDELPEVLYRSLVTPLRDVVPLACNDGTFGLMARVDGGMLKLISESMDGHCGQSEWRIEGICWLQDFRQKLLAIGFT